MIAYAICFILMGRMIDIMGTRKGYLVSIGIWSIAAMGHALARSWIGFAIARFSLAVGQSGNFPSAIKSVAEWFPKKDRALAVGIFNGGANMGTILAPLIIKGRKLGMLACALFAVPVMLVPHTSNMWMSVGLIALAAGGHCGWSANAFSLMSDIFPKKATGTVAGFGGFAVAVGEIGRAHV